MKVIILALLLAGCSLTSYELEKAQELCAEHGGVYKIHFDGPNPKATCSDGTYVGKVNE